MCTCGGRQWVQHKLVILMDDVPIIPENHGEVVNSFEGTIDAEVHPCRRFFSLLFVVFWLFLFH